MRLNIDLTQDKTERKVFFTSDFHLFHHKVIEYDNRPFKNIDEMHQAIENGWNETVGENDLVVYVGDLSFAKAKDKHLVEGILWRLNGEIHFVMGNHDDWREISKIKRFESVQDYLEVRIKHMVEDDDHVGLLKKVETLFCCMHYPIYSWNKSHHGSLMIHGHCHGNLHHGEEASFYVNRRVIDVGCMLHDYKPISYLEVMEKLTGVVLPNLKRNNH